MTLQIAHLKFKSELTGVTQEQVQDTLDKISDMAVYLADTIDDFQNFFKPNKDKEEISIKKLSEQAINFATPRLKMFDINITHFCIDDEIIKTHTNEVTQVIINLLNNATDQLIEQKIKNKKIKVTTKLDHELLTISIEDNGGGIKEENIEKIFDPYFSTKKKNGTGIGLYMGKMIIENELGGTLTASNSDEGAKFTIALNRNSIHLQEDEHA
jgi:C4-dicarboxylate-specific signal transduction histidine kinase